MDLQLISQLPSPTPQQLYNFVLPAIAIITALLVLIKLWTNIKGAFVTRVEFDALVKRVDDMQESIIGTDKTRMAKILDRVEAIHEEVKRRHR